MKIFNITQIRELDQITILQEPISSIDLMERASKAIVNWIYDKYININTKFIVFCGKGNNGGDGLAVSRLLLQKGYKVEIFYLDGDSYSADFQTNMDRLNAMKMEDIHRISKVEEFPKLTSDEVIIDALLGSGIRGSVHGLTQVVINSINKLDQEIISIDVPSGFVADQPTGPTSIRATYTLSLECPKRGFMFPENADYIGKYYIISIGLSEEAKREMTTNQYLTEYTDACSMIKNRSTHDHKGTFGHALLINGSHGKIGAAILAARACLRSGIGLLTVHVPTCGYSIIQTAIPEAMVDLDVHATLFTEVNDLEKFAAIGIGCGIGTNPQVALALEELLKKYKHPMVLDADALNLISITPHLKELIPRGSILTPHVKEFSRLFGSTADSFERNDLQMSKSKELGIYIILKGANTAISFPDGSCHYNSTGNPGMATAGSGDVLTGVLTSLLAQGYSAGECCLLGTFVHGFAGDIASELLGHESLIASDIIEHLGVAFKEIHNCR